MRDGSILIALAFAASCAPSPTSKADATPTPFNDAQLMVYPDARGLPADVQAFVARHEDCQHFRTEPAFDEARARDLAEAVEDVCAGIDAAAAALRERYQRDAAVSAALARYEEVGL